MSGKLPASARRTAPFCNSKHDLNLETDESDLKVLGHRLARKK